MPTAPTTHGLTHHPHAGPYSSCPSLCGGFRCLCFHGDRHASLWSDLLSPTARSCYRAPRNPGDCLNYDGDLHSLNRCRHPFINASGYWNPDHGQLGDDGEAYRRWQARIVRYRRDGKRSKSNNQTPQKYKTNNTTVRATHVKKNIVKVLNAKQAYRQLQDKQNKVISSLGLATVVQSRFRPSPPLLLCPHPWYPLRRQHFRKSNE